MTLFEALFTFSMGCFGVMIGGIILGKMFQHFGWT